MIQINNISKAYGKQVLFDSITCTINSGERVGLVGRNGSGKSTLFRMILGEEHPDDGTITVPQGYRVGHLSQHIRFTEKTVLKEACLSMIPRDDGIDETYKVKKILSGLGFSGEELEGSPQSLSGGYQIRLNLAKVLVEGPNLLLLDEPTNYLDIVSIRWLGQVLRTWNGELIIITHDRNFMDSVTTHTMGIHRCKIRKIPGTTQKLYDQILLEEEVYEKTRINDEKKRKEVEQFISRFRAQANKAKAVQSRIKSLGKKERLERLAEAKNLDFSFHAAPFTGKQLLVAENISFGFHQDNLLIRKLSLAIGKKDRIAIIGKNGKGKTTLLNLLAGELMPLQGSVAVHPAAKIAYFGQTNISRLHPAKTVEQEIMDVHPDHSRGSARKICGLMMFEGDNALKKISVLSGGEKSRVLLGRILVSPANLLFLDEPTNHLDMESIDSLIEAIEAFDGAVVIVTHSEMILNAIAERLVVFDDDSVTVFEGSYQDFLERVGWKDEIADSRETARAAKGERGTSRKDLRKMRAEIIESRSRVLNPMQKRMDEIERIIVQLEKNVEDSNQTLLDASVRGDGDTVVSMSRELADAQKRIEDLFDELAVLTEKFEIASRKFEEQLNEVA
jgi:ATP-binding cassette subfamily F protein 3